MTTQQAQLLTLAFLVVDTAVVILFDVAVIYLFGPDASISRVLGRVLQAWPTVAMALTFWLGLLVGHLWLPAQ